MGQKFYIVNLDRREYIHPHKVHYCPDLHLWQMAANNCLGILTLLLRQASGYGEGDILKPYAHAGRWAGHRIAIVGERDASGIFEQCASGLYREITDEIQQEWDDFIDHDSLKISTRKA